MVCAGKSRNAATLRGILSKNTPKPPRIAVRPSLVGATTNPTRGAKLMASAERLSTSPRTPKSSTKRGWICQLSWTNKANSLLAAAAAAGIACGYLICALRVWFSAARTRAGWRPVHCRLRARKNNRELRDAVLSIRVAAGAGSATTGRAGCDAAAYRSMRQNSARERTPSPYPAGWRNRCAGRVV